jgi:hypothetical protein
MTRFLDVRLAPVGGGLATSVATMQGTDIGNYQSLGLPQLVAGIQGRHVLLVAHGFNVNRADGIQHLSNWETLLHLDPPSALAPQSVFVGLLWPGDSIFAHGLDFPEEPRIADEAGSQLIAPFLDANFGGAASISFASHSLGARVVLRTISKMSRRARRAMLMAGAIDDNCLTAEFQDAAANIDQISVLASREDEVLALAFPLGNPISGILDVGHPWFKAALGRTGPANPPPGNFQAPFEIPDVWNFGHHNYLQIDPPPPAPVPMPMNVPPPGSPLPAGGATGWQEGFSAAFVSTRFE